MVDCIQMFMILFCKYIFKLLDKNSVDIVKTMDWIKVRGNVRISKDGGIAGGNSKIYAAYDKSTLESTFIYIELETVFG